MVSDASARNPPKSRLRMAGAGRFVWNRGLARRKEAYVATGKGLSPDHLLAYELLPALLAKCFDAVTRFSRVWGCTSELAENTSSHPGNRTQADTLKRGCGGAIIPWFSPRHGEATGIDGLLPVRRRRTHHGGRRMCAKISLGTAFPEHLET